MAFRIDPYAIYDEYELRQAGAFAEADLKRARLKGELRYKELGRGKRVYRGIWLIRWLQGKDAKPKSKDAKPKPKGKGEE